MRHLAILPFFFFGMYAAAFEPNAIFLNPLAMTVTQTLAGPTKDLSKRTTVTVLPNRPKTYLLEDYKDLHFTYQVQPKKDAPLVFIIPGTGGISESNGALFLAEKLYGMGYHTVTVDDGFSWRFAVAASHSGLPGYTPRDAVDMYAALQAVNAKLVEKKAIAPSSYSLIGYSLGGLEGMFLHRLDESAHHFNFSRVVMVDPPLDVLNAVKAIDHLYEVGDKLSDDRKLLVFNRVLDVGSNLLSQHADFTDASVLQGAFTELNFNNDDLSYLIGGSFRDSLRDVVFASQQLNDMKILKNTATRYHMNKRYDEARQFSFIQYMKTFVYPNVKKQKSANYSVEDMNREVSMYQFHDYIQAHKNLFIVHTADDFILKDGDIAWMQDTFKERALIFPHGGHCGAINFPQFTDYLKKVF